MDKEYVRKEALKNRDQLPIPIRLAYSQTICDKVLRWNAYQVADMILCYIPFRSEVETWDVIQDAWKQGKHVFCPKCYDNSKMEFYEISSREDLEEGAYGILEPKVSKGLRQYLSEEAYCMLIPGAAFDREGNRLGYGKGYYDRYLERFPHGIKIAMAFSCQLQEKIQTEITDQKMDYIMTENEVIHCV